MSVATMDMELTERDREVLAVLAVRASNPYHIREETDHGKGDVNTSLNRLAQMQCARKVTRGLYEITDHGRGRLNDD